MSAVTIDVVAERSDGSVCLYLVEEGPWPADHSQRLRALQKRLFDVVGPKFADKQSGFTRITKIGFRRGDAATRVKLELAVD